MRRTCFSIVLLLLLAGVLAAAPGEGPGFQFQGPPPGPLMGPMGNPGMGQEDGIGVMARGENREGLKKLLRRLAQFLELTEEQTSGLQTILQERRDQLAPLREELQALGQSLREQLNSDSPDALAVGELVINMHNIRQEMEAIRKDATAAFEALLSEEQLRKLQFLRRAVRLAPLGRALQHLGLL